MKTTAATILLLLVSLTTWSQSTRFGLYAELLYSNDHVSLDDTGYDDLDITSKRKPGFAIGTLWYFHPERTVSLRITPGLGLLNKTVRADFFMRPTDPEDPLIATGYEEITRPNFFLKTPVHVVFRIREQSNFGIVAGATPYLTLVKVNDAYGVDFKEIDVSADAGIHYTIPCKGSTVIVPELKYSYGLTNSIRNSSGSFEAIDRLGRNHFALTVFIAW